MGLHKHAQTENTAGGSTSDSSLAERLAKSCKNGEEKQEYINCDFVIFSVADI